MSSDSILPGRWFLGLPVCVLRFLGLPVCVLRFFGLPVLGLVMSPLAVLIVAVYDLILFEPGWCGLVRLPVVRGLFVRWFV